MGYDEVKGWRRRLKKNKRATNFHGLKKVEEDKEQANFVGFENTIAFSWVFKVLYLSGFLTKKIGYMLRFLKNRNI